MTWSLHSSEGPGFPGAHRLSRNWLLSLTFCVCLPLGPRGFPELRLPPLSVSLRLSRSGHVSVSFPESLCLFLPLSQPRTSSLPSLSESPTRSGVGPGLLTAPMTRPLLPTRQYPDGVFYDLDSCKHSSYPDSEGAPGERSWPRPLPTCPLGPFHGWAAKGLRGAGAVPRRSRARLAQAPSPLPPCPLPPVRAHANPGVGDLHGPQWPLCARGFQGEGAPARPPGS